MVGKTISHYKILEKLGEGGMGVVYRAEDTKLKRMVALKFLPPDLTCDPEAKARFIHEARAASTLDHPTICTIYEIGETKPAAGEPGNNQLFISMACYEGQTLKDRIKVGAIHESPLPIIEIIDISVQVAQGLEKAHNRGIVHRDIKPANIYLTKDGVVKILDFGLAKLRGQTKLTKTGTTLGTVSYMSPEQTKGEDVDHRTDIWSMGVVLHEMITGQLPFKGDYDQAVVYSILNEELKPVTESRPEIPIEFNSIVKKALSKSPNERYQKTTDILTDLNALKRKIESKAKKEHDMDTERIPSIAVLPFVNMSSDPENEYFGDGLAEELINALTRLKGLRVAARTSAFCFKGRESDIREIGRQLNVSNILEGSVRKAGNRLRVTAQLINVEDGYHLWSERYDREMKDIFAIQDEITDEVIGKLKTSLLAVHSPAEERRSTNFQAYEWYLKGRYYWNKFSAEHVEKTIECYHKAIEKDPDYALAHTALAEVYIFQATAFGLRPCGEAMPKAKAEAERALHLDPNLPEAHAVLGMVATFFEWDSEKAKKYFRRVMELNPNYAGSYLWLEFPLSLFDKNFDEAIAILNRSLELDPLNLLVRIRLGYLYYYKYDFDRAIEEFQKTLDIEPYFAPGHHGLMDAYGQKGMYDQALSEGEKTLAVAGHAIGHVGVLGYYCGRAGKEKEAREYLSELLDRSKDDFISPFWIATIYLGLNETDRVFEWFNKALEQRDGNLLYTMAPPFDSIRTDPRFIELRKNMGLKP